MEASERKSTLWVDCQSIVLSYSAIVLLSQTHPDLPSAMGRAWVLKLVMGSDPYHYRYCCKYHDLWVSSAKWEYCWYHRVVLELEIMRVKCLVYTCSMNDNLDIIRNHPLIALDVVWSREKKWYKEKARSILLGCGVSELCLPPNHTHL